MNEQSTFDRDRFDVLDSGHESAVPSGGRSTAAVPLRIRVSHSDAAAAQEHSVLHLSGAISHDGLI